VIGKIVKAVFAQNVTVMQSDTKNGNLTVEDLKTINMSAKIVGMCGGSKALMPKKSGGCWSENEIQIYPFR